MKHLESSINYLRLEDAQRRLSALHESAKTVGSTPEATHLATLWLSLQRDLVISKQPFRNQVETIEGEIESHPFKIFAPKLPSIIMLTLLHFIVIYIASKITCKLRGKKMVRNRLPALCFAFVLVLFVTPSQCRSQGNGLRPLGTVLPSASQEDVFSFAEKFVLGSSGNIYILDTGLSKIFTLNDKNSRVTSLCRPRALGSTSFTDVSVSTENQIWGLDALKSKVFKIDSQCKVQTSFSCRNTPLRLLINSFGEILVLTGEGDTLFDLYSSDGKLIRSFGKRIRYGNPIADSELSDGRLCADGSGGFYFSFNYPPLIHHYDRKGRLIHEFKPESSVTISPPSVSSQQQGRTMTVSSRYQILVLDMAADNQGRLYLLMSGENKHRALTQGSRKLLVTTNKGKAVKQLSLENNFHRLAVKNKTLYLLKNRKGLILGKYALN